MPYDHLFSPLAIGNREVRNRIFVSAHHNNFDVHGLWTDRTIKYYEARADGGAGMIVTGAIRIHPRNLEFETWPRSDWAFADGQVDWFKKGVKAVKAHGAVFIAQLAHGGRQFWDAREDLQPLLAPSAVPCPVIMEVPKEMEPEDIEQTIDDFVAAAEIARDGGFDGVEIHSAYGYLLAGFLTPTANLRTDEFGGDLDSRMRFALTVLERVREVMGPDRIVGVRMIGDEYLEGGLTPEDAPAIAAAFEKSGLVDYISVTSGTYASGVIMDPPMYAPMGYDVPIAALVKDAVDLPVLIAGRIKDPAMADDIIASGRADMVAMTRATICDPDLPRKALEGRDDEIRWCIGCNQRCLGNVAHHLPIGCFQNPASGREFDPFWAQLQPADPPKRVVVVGAGPAGCEAAKVLAERGHEVVLFDRRSELGGQIRTVEKASGREEWQDVYRYFDNRLPALGVDLRLGAEVNADQVLAERPDTVVIATGSNPRTEPWEHLPPIEGEGSTVDVRAVLNGAVSIGDRVVVYAGDNHMQGLTTADTLLDQGKDVTLVVPNEAAGLLAEEHTRFVVSARLAAKGAAMVMMSALTGFDGGSVSGVEMMTGEEFELPCDTLISSFGGVADDSLYFALKGRVTDLHRIGDCLAPRTADSAIFEGSRLGRII